MATMPASQGLVMPRPAWRRALLAGCSALALNASLTAAIVTAAMPQASAAVTISTNGATFSGTGDVVTAYTGTIYNYWTAFTNTGTVGTLINSGTLLGNSTGLSNTGTIGTLVNNNAISGTSVGIANTRTIGALTNNGLISAAAYDAIYNSGSLGLITNNGVIAGNIGSPGQDLTFAGGSNGTIGTLTGVLASGAFHVFLPSDGLGTITTSGVTFISGALLLNDRINVGTGTVANAGADLHVNQSIPITGNYTQGSNGALVIDVASASSYGELVVSGSAALTDSTVSITAINGATLTAGETFTVVSAGALSASGLTVSTEGLYSDTVSIGSTDLLVTLNNVGPVTAAVTRMQTLTSGTGSISNSGTITAATGVMVGGSGVTLINAGVIDASGVGVVIGGAAGAASITNSGAISGAIGVVNGGTIGALTNSGTISGSRYALYNAGSLGLLTDNGTIAGDIASPSQDLTIAGGSGGTAGVLTGYASGSIGTITASGVTVTSGALLLNDRINVGNGTVTNAGAALQVNQAVSISGNYSQGSSGTLVIGVAATSGELVVSGTASLTGSKVAIAPQNGAILTVGEIFTIVSAGSLVESGVTATTSGFTDIVSADGNRLMVRLDSLSTWTQRADAAGRGAIPMGPVLDTLNTVTAFQPMLAQLSSLPTAAQTHALRQLNASQVTPQVNAAGDTTAPTTLAVEQHEMALRDGDGKAAGSEYRQGALWGQVLGGQATQDTSGKADGYTASSFGLMFGADLPLTDDLTGGLALDWLRGTSRGKADSSGNSTRLDSYQLTAYGAWRPDGGDAFVQGLLAAGFNRYDQKRAIDFLGETAAAKFDGRHYQVKLGAGYDIPVAAGLAATPLGSLQVVRVESDAYREQGAGQADLSVDRQGFNAAESELGGRLASGFDSDWGKVSGDVKAAWVHSFTNGPIATSAAMGGVGFVSTTGRPAADGIRLATGLTLQQSDDLSIRLEYDGDLRSDYRSHTGLLKITSAF